MDLNEIPNDQMVIKATKFDGKVVGESQNSGIKDIELARRRCRETEEKCLAIKLEIRKKSMDLERVKARVRVLESEKVAIEEEIEGLRKKKANLEGTRVDEKLGDGKLLSLDDWKMDDDEESKVDQLMIENKVLECEKTSALKEVEIWKQKCKELESRVLELEGKLGCQGIDRIPIGRKEATENGGLGSSSHSPGARNGGIQMEGTPCIGSPQKRYALNEDAQTTRVQPGISVKRRLLFQNENSCNRKLAPSTPAGARSSSGVLINIVDSDDECDIPAKHGFDATPGAGSDGASGILDQADVSGCTGELPFIGTPKRKRDPKVFTSDGEHEAEESLPRKRNFKIYNSDNDGEDDDDIRPIKQPFNSSDAERESGDDDDNIPISQLKMKRGRVLNQSTGSNRRSYSGRQADNADSLTHRRRRRLVKFEQGEKKGRPQETENSPGNLVIENVEDDNREEDYSDSDSGSVSSFIVDDDDVEDVEDDESEDDDSNEFHAPEDSSDDNLDFKDIISRLQRRKDPNSKWDLQGDMLSAFAKDPELCMRAVCALFRQQTSAEKLCKESLVQNGRGFSKFDASRGTRLGEFLTGGDPNGDLVKSKEELQKHDPYGLEECCRLAKHYSKQLFEIYKNGEDSFFS